MKKFISVTLIAILALSVSVTAFASEGLSTPDSADLETQLKQDANQYFYEGKANLDDIEVIYFGELSDGSFLVDIDITSASPDATSYYYTLGGYQYSCVADDQAYIYKNNTFYFLPDAYELGMIDNKMLDELYQCSVECLKKPTSGGVFVMFPTEDVSDLDRQIQQDANEYFFNGNENPDYITVTYYGELSDGSLVLNTHLGGSLDFWREVPLGDYKYSYGGGEEAYIYKDHTFCFLLDAYEEGMLSDEIMEELYHCSVEYMKNPVNYKTFIFEPLDIDNADEVNETTTQPTETTVQVIEPANSDATSSTDVTETKATATETKPVATADKATTNNSNGAVQTGQSGFAIVISLVFALTAAVIGFTKYGYNK